MPIFLRPLGGALKNRSAAPDSPPCFRRRRTGCGTQHPLRLACVSLAAAPTTPRCFRRWRRSSSLQSAPLLFESTLESETSVFYKTKSPAYFRTLSIFGGRGWITQAALLKTAHWAVFARRDAKRRALRVALADFSATPWRGLEKSERCPSLASLFPPQAVVGSAAVRIHPRK